MRVGCPNPRARAALAVSTNSAQHCVNNRRCPLVSALSLADRDSRSADGWCALSTIPGAQTIALRPLSTDQTAALIGELLGTDSSVHGLAEHIAERTAGNPFFAEEIVRDLAERGAIRGTRGSYVLHGDIADVIVPATLQAAIAARVDRLSHSAKRTLSAASVIGSRFNPDLLTGLGIEPALNELTKAELIDQVVFAPRVEYAFRHPRIRTVAYESQLKSDRAELHRRLAISVQRSTGTCAQAHGSPTATSPERGRVGSARDTSPTDCPKPTWTVPRCGSLPGRCSAPAPGLPAAAWPTPALRTAGTCRRHRRQGIAGYGDDRVGVDADCSRPLPRSIAPGFRTHQSARVDRRPDADAGAALRGGRGQAADRRACRSPAVGTTHDRPGRLATHPRETSSSVHRWRPRPCCGDARGVRLGHPRWRGDIDDRGDDGPRVRCDDARVDPGLQVLVTHPQRVVAAGCWRSCKKPLSCLRSRSDPATISRWPAPRSVRGLALVADDGTQREDWPRPACRGP